MEIKQNDFCNLYHINFRIVILLFSCFILIQPVDIRSEIRVDSIPHPEWKGKSVYLFRSKSASPVQPVVFFCHGAGAPDPDSYRHFLDHIAKRGFSVIYTPFKTNVAALNPEKCYRMIWSGFRAGVNAWSAILDTTKIGVVGHSYGGGAVPGITRKAITEQHWGTQAVFLYIMAPWFSHWIDQSQLENFPKHPILLMQCFERDNINDPRMGIDIYNTIGIPPSQKGFIYLRSDTCSKPVLEAGHRVPEGTNYNDSEVNALDIYGIYPFFDALASNAINSDTTAWHSIFATGAGRIKSLQICSESKTNRQELTGINHIPLLPEICYINFWHHVRNPRAHAVSNPGNSMQYSPSDSRTTLSNYFSLLLYPAQIKAREEDLKEEGIEDWDEKIEYRTSGTYTSMINTLGKHRECGPKPIKQGYGARGSCNVMQRFVPHSGKGDRDIYIHLPEIKGQLLPLIFFAPGKNTNANRYRELLFHIASRGYVVISSSFVHGLFKNDKKRYDVLNEGFDIGIELVRGIIDTTRIGFIGHGYGARAILSSVSKYLTINRWGVKSSFLFLMSPSHFKTEDKAYTRKLPKHIQSIIQVFDDDVANDWQIAKEIFYALPTQSSQKLFMIGHSYEDDECDMEADHNCPLCEERDEDLNGIDEHVIFRSLDALTDYTFNNNKSALVNSGFSDQKSGEYTVKFPGRKWRAITYSTDPKLLPGRKTFLED